MLKNVLLLAWRNLRKNPLYSMINIVGLAVGITCSLLIFLWVHNETSFNKFLPKYDRIYQVWVNASFNSTINTWRSVPLPAYEAMKTADHRIVNSVVTDWGFDHLIRSGENSLLKKGYYASEEFLEIFEFPLVAGDRATALNDPGSIVISESTAKALFGNADPINQTILLDEEYNLKVTAVIEDLPENSSFQFALLIPWKHRESANPWIAENRDNWENYSFQVFVELNDPSGVEEANASIRNMLAEHGQDEVPREFFLYPISHWRLFFKFENGQEKGGLIEYVRLFSVIAIFILVIACINFMNLSTARSEKRAKEVGIRKSIGAGKIELIIQFLGESVIIAFLAYLIALILVIVTLPYYNDLISKELTVPFGSPLFWLTSLGLVTFTGLLAGSYPAFYLSSFNPAKTLKGIHTRGETGSIPRKMLVTMQFVFAIFLIAGTWLIFQQINLTRSRSLGYEQSHLLMLDYTTELDKNYEAFKNELISSGAVEAVTRANSKVTAVSVNNFVVWPGKPEEERIMFSTIAAGYDYTKTMGIQLLEGRDFSPSFRSDSTAIVINKAALDLMDLEDPIGTELKVWGEPYRLIGVMDNVLMESVYSDIRPLFMILDDWGGVIHLRLSRNQDIRSSMNTVKQIFEKLNPAYPFDYKFADVEFEQKFDDIKLTRRLAVIFSSLAVMITGLGLIGLASYTAEQRTKEIGIRKVMGASVPNLIGLLSREFTLMVSMAFVVATPLTWWMLDGYLDKYPIRIAIHWWVFPLTGSLVLLFTLLIVSYQARKAANTNPVDSLRME